MERYFGRMASGTLCRLPTGMVGYSFGDRLTDAVLKEPCGMAVNSSGELYVCCKIAIAL